MAIRDAKRRQVDLRRVLERLPNRTWADLGPSEDVTLDRTLRGSMTSVLILNRRL